ncbi:hypothetical protein RGQ15_09885 [Paracoccus sp. MBLB3053]|uniref:AAA+ family ATPase n=1 Tax=Paracoccus aurantius TaxID=3073814 RepID=A0ABU2HS63_9RHOB|nr:hypothetical protein [Paracoccus sp. MBLB3053]MDS9467877.1 hypothetical protein [Paracoccus sp. MBLB3053]
MQRLAAFFLSTVMASGPALAQTPYEPPPADDREGGLESDIENGIQGFMEKLLNEVQPHLDQLGRDLNDTMNSFSPVLDDLGSLMDDVGNYQAPERLENGDILIRRRADAPPPPKIGDTLRDFLAPETPPGSESAPSPDAPEPMPDSSGAPEIEL